MKTVKLYQRNASPNGDLSHWAEKGRGVITSANRTGANVRWFNEETNVLQRMAEWSPWNSRRQKLVVYNNQ